MSVSRDLHIVQFLQTVQIARTDQIQRLFFPSPQRCRKRLDILLKAHMLYRTEMMPANAGYAWATKPVRYCLKMPHDLAITEAYVRKVLAKDAPTAFYTDVVLKGVGIRPDALMICASGSYLIEADMGTNGLSRLGQKVHGYKQAFDLGTWKQRFEQFPTLLIVSPVQQPTLRVKVPFRVQFMQLGVSM